MSSKDKEVIAKYASQQYLKTADSYWWNILQVHSAMEMGAVTTPVEMGAVTESEGIPTAAELQIRLIRDINWLRKHLSNKVMSQDNIALNQALIVLEALLTREAKMIVRT